MCPAKTVWRSGYWQGRVLSRGNAADRRGAAGAAGWCGLAHKVMGAGVAASPHFPLDRPPAREGGHSHRGRIGSHSRPCGLVRFPLGSLNRSISARLSPLADRRRSKLLRLPFRGSFRPKASGSAGLCFGKWVRHRLSPQPRASSWHSPCRSASFFGFHPCGCPPCLPRVAMAWRFPPRFRGEPLPATHASCHAFRVAPNGICLWITSITGISLKSGSGRLIPCRNIVGQRRDRPGTAGLCRSLHPPSTTAM